MVLTEREEATKTTYRDAMEDAIARCRAQVVNGVEPAPELRAMVGELIPLLRQYAHLYGETIDLPTELATLNLRSEASEAMRRRAAR